MKSILPKLGEWILCIIVAVILTFLMKTFLFNITEVSGASMNSTLKDKDRVVFEKITTYTKNYKTGDIIVLKPVDEDDLFIKRIVGVPGDSVEIKNGSVYINGKLLKETYLDPNTPTENDLKITLDSSHVFVLGDNRINSKDSRIIGPIPIENIKGHVVFRLYPFDNIGSLS